MRARLELYRNADLINFPALNRVLNLLNIAGMGSNSAYAVVGPALQLHLQWRDHGQTQTHLVAFCAPLPQAEPTHHNLDTLMDAPHSWGWNSGLSDAELHSFDLSEEHLLGRLAAAIESLEYGTVKPLDESVAFWHGKAQGLRLLALPGPATMAEQVRENLRRKAEVI